jgi:hypothetical protein
VAVAVPRTPFLVLDECYTVVEVSEPARAELGLLLGRNLWELLPDAEPLFRPHYEEAWRTGEPVEFVQFYGGRVRRVHAHAQRGRLEVFWELLAQLDTVTLEGLRSSVAQAISALEEGEIGSRRELPRRTLRLVKGAA